MWWGLKLIFTELDSLYRGHWQCRHYEFSILYHSIFQPQSHPLDIIIIDHTLISQSLLEKREVIFHYDFSSFSSSTFLGFESQSLFSPWIVWDPSWMSLLAYGIALLSVLFTSVISHKISTLWELKWRNSRTCTKMWRKGWNVKRNVRRSVFV